MNKDRKKELRKKYAQEQKSRLEQSLPFDKAMFVHLFNYLDKVLLNHDCDNTLKYTMVFLQHNKLVGWLKKTAAFATAKYGQISRTEYLNSKKINTENANRHFPDGFLKGQMSL